MKNIYTTTNLKDTITTATVIAAIFLATVGTAVASSLSHTDTTLSAMPTLAMETIIVSAQRMPTATLDTIVISAKR